MNPLAYLFVGIAIGAVLSALIAFLLFELIYFR